MMPICLKADSDLFDWVFELNTRLMWKKLYVLNRVLVYIKPDKMALARMDFIENQMAPWHRFNMAEGPSF
jgi:hypothetical protein